MSIGETGSLRDNTTYEGEPIEVEFSEALTDPVVALTATNKGGNTFSLRVIEFRTDANGDATGFSFTLDEWENHDGAHPAMETINWIAIESGTHVLPDGRLIEAGYAQADSHGEDVTLSHDFPDTPVVLTTVASDRHASHVDSDPTKVGAKGFTLSLEEAESQDGVHGLEKVGWIAVQAGGDGSAGIASNARAVDSDWAAFGLGATFSDPVVLAETQTKNEADTGNVIFRNLDADEVDLRFEEETSADKETSHGSETVALVAFEAGMILCFTAGTMIDTPLGPRPVERLAAGDAVLTLDHGAQPLLWAGGSAFDAAALRARPRLTPIRIPAGALGPGNLSRDTLVSPQHRLLLRDWRAELCLAAGRCWRRPRRSSRRSLTSGPCTMSTCSSRGTRSSWRTERPWKASIPARCANRPSPAPRGRRSSPCFHRFARHRPHGGPSRAPPSARGRPRYSRRMPVSLSSRRAIP